MLICEACERVQSRQTARYCEYCSSSRLKDQEPEHDPNALAEEDLFGDADLPLILDPTKPQYKVLSQKDRFFSNKFNPALLERALNEYAQEGWVLKAAVSADFPSLGGSRNELVMFLEKAPQ